MTNEQIPRKTSELTCCRCGRHYIYRRLPEQYDTGSPRHCPECRAELLAQRQRELEAVEQEKRRQKAAEEHRIFVERLTDWNTVPYESIHPQGEGVLYIIGNGFDLMHRAPSSYYSFRDSLGRHCSLRETLETYITDSDLWSDFESSLAHFNISAMSSGDVVDMWLDTFGVYNDNASAKDHALAVEAAATPLYTVTSELPRRLYSWVSTLAPGTADRPLKSMIKNDRVLCFNYTEFIETLYGVAPQNVCYIHGCRRRAKNAPRPSLVIGHRPGESDAAFEFEDDLRKVTPSRGRREFIRLMQENVLCHLSEYDNDLTKDSCSIIAAHAPFFASLNDVTTVISIGHSFSPVDRYYFRKIRDSIPEETHVSWYFGCYGLRDLENLEKMLAYIGLDRRGVTVFRTDTISTTPSSPADVHANSRNSSKAPKPRKPHKRCVSHDGVWGAESRENVLTVTNQRQNALDYETAFPCGIARVFFSPDEQCLFAVVYGIDPGVFLFRITAGHWRFVGELICTHQGLLVPRLRRVMITEADIAFIYNNRVRRYSLENGAELSNVSKRGAKDISYPGDDITNMFARR